MNSSAGPTPTPSLSSGESGSSYRSTLPSTAQTHSLSLLLSHELAHLLLSHPLESLSLHRTASLMRDVVEDAVTALVWPVASAMGPWGAEWGRKAVGSVARGRKQKKGDGVKDGWWIRTAEMESEADEVALRSVHSLGHSLGDETDCGTTGSWLTPGSTRGWRSRTGAAATSRGLVTSRQPRERGSVRGKALRFDTVASSSSKLEGIGL